MDKAERPTRVELQEDIQINVLSCDEDPLLADARLAARTMDISESGVKVWLYVPVPETTRVSLEVPGEEGLRLEGEVRWVEDGGDIRVGVLIDETSADLSAWREKFSHSLNHADKVLH